MEIQQREFVGELFDGGPEVTLTVMEFVYDDDTTETRSRTAEVEGEAVSLSDLSRRYGRRIVAAFVETALEHAR
ncbi:MAG: hypothetical protein ACRDTJ_26645 [Pseudonocardiaceae bacterium]